MAFPVLLKKLFKNEGAGPQLNNSILPPPTSTELGAVKAGTNVTIDANGVISADGAVKTVNSTSPDANGNISITSVTNATNATNATKATQDGSGNVITSTYLTKTDASSTYLGKTAKAASATSADSATKATKDGSGNVITSTYLTVTSASNTYLTKTDASSTYLGKSATAASATKATQDGNGANIASTYLKLTGNINQLTGTNSYTASTQTQKSFHTNGAISGTIDETSSSGSGNISSTTYTFNTLSGIPAGNYTLIQVLQKLINMSHTHKSAKGTVSSNCNCDCDCACNCDD